MTLWQTSLTYRVWVWLCNVYEDSALHRILAAVGRWCSEQIEDSRVLSISRERCSMHGTRRGI